MEWYNEIEKWLSYLNKLIENNQFPEERLKKIYIITLYMLEGNYVKAEQKYLDLNVGISYEGTTSESLIYNDKKFDGLKLLPSEDLRSMMFV